MEPREIPQERCHDPYLRCALYGAAQTCFGVSGCCVLAHSPQGCHQLVDAAFGWQNADYTETLSLCTKLCEDEIVFGGEETLARTIRDAKEFGVPILFVLTACGPEIVGDDVVAVCEEMRSEVDFEIVPILSAGFRGDQNDGTDIALQAMLEQLVPAERAYTIPRSVVLVAPHANANPTWMGDLDWVQGVLGELGATIAATLTHDTALADFCRVPEAQGCIVLSHDAGKSAADSLAERYGIAQWLADLPLPIGLGNTRRWLEELGQRLGAEDGVHRLISEGESLVVETCRRKGLEQSGLHRAPTAIVADATTGIPLVRFLAEDLETIPELVCLRSDQEGTERLLQSELTDLGLSPKVLLRSDVYASKKALDEVRPEMVFASNIERHAVREMGIPYPIRLVSPISRTRMTDRAYLGYTGTLNLIEEMQNERTEAWRSKRQRYRARW